jgi:hypothetical protein
MVRVVEANRDEVADLSDAGTEPNPGGNDRQRLGINGPNFFKTFGQESWTSDIWNHAGEVPDLVIRIDEARLFLSGRPKAHELHGHIL